MKMCYCCVVLSKDGTLVAVDGWTHVNPFFWAPILPVLNVRIISFVHLATTKGAPRPPHRQVAKSNTSHPVSFKTRAESGAPTSMC